MDYEIINIKITTLEQNKTDPEIVQAIVNELKEIFKEDETNGETS